MDMNNPDGTNREATVILVASAIVLVTLGTALYRYLRRRRFQKQINQTLAGLDKKYLLPEVITRPLDQDGAFLYDTLASANKSLADEVAGYDRAMKNFRDYIELWGHEIKTPLTGLKLSLRRGSRAQKIYLEAIENYIDQALFYAKVDTVAKDYVIREVSLAAVVGAVVRGNKDALIAAGIKIHTENLDATVMSDSKWLTFIINQFVLNAIKYRKNNDPEIEFRAEKRSSNPEASLALIIRDNGIGIKHSEQSHIFGKGFTGSNDRARQSSTGMGLYLSSRLATDLGHRLTIASNEGEWTELRLEFGSDDYLEPSRKPASSDLTVSSHFGKEKA